ncbi:hypothetical protein B0A55_10785 [Friedmanniomyces simplex]|uniref:Uncharacterized protein n=1 Tax=Friedmanniomyces simplex TaxID=329884 RepID=A0A4U0WMN2_9PEZI|nr:hypothetical protein B0A55_10785 [Friedmanniomyces simplex]
MEPQLFSPTPSVNSRPETPASTNAAEEGINPRLKRRGKESIRGTLENTRRNERNTFKQQLDKFITSAKSQMVATRDMEAKLQQVLFQRMQEREDRGTDTVRMRFPQQYDPDEAPTAQQRQLAAPSKKSNTEIMKYLHGSGAGEESITVQHRRTAHAIKGSQLLRPRARVSYNEESDDDDEEDEPNTPPVKRSEVTVVCDRSLAIRNGCADAASSKTEARSADNNTKATDNSSSVGRNIATGARRWRLVDGKMVVYPPFAEAGLEVAAVRHAQSGSAEDALAIAPTGRSSNELTLRVKRSWQWVGGKMVVWPPFDSKHGSDDLVPGIKRKVASEAEGAGMAKKARVW